MIDFFSSLYSAIQSRNSLLDKIRFYSLCRLVVRNIANLILPAYLRLSEKPRINISSGTVEKKPLLIASLTTFPARIDKVWIVIESIMRQTHKPDRVMLWLSREQFPDGCILPESLRDLEKRGLEVVFCDGDMRSHKKYYYVLKNFPEAYLFTFDDDIIYRSTLISELMDLHNEFPGAICCDRTLKINKTDGDILPYKTWGEIKTGTEPSRELFHTSGAGTLYFPGALHPAVLDSEVFLKYCMYADDIWLNCMAQLNQTPIVKVKRYITWLPVINKIKISLMKINVDEGQNDVQLNNVREYFKKEMGKDPFDWVSDV